MKRRLSFKKSTISKTVVWNYGGTFDYPAKLEKLQELDHELQDPHIWNHPEKAQQLGKERAQLQQIVDTFQQLEKGLNEIKDLYDLALTEDAQDLLVTLPQELQTCQFSV